MEKKEMDKNIKSMISALEGRFVSFSTDYDKWMYKTFYMRSPDSPGSSFVHRGAWFLTAAGRDYEEYEPIYFRGVIFNEEVRRDVVILDDSQRIVEVLWDDPYTSDLDSMRSNCPAYIRDITKYYGPFKYVGSIHAVIEVWDETLEVWQIMKRDPDTEKFIGNVWSDYLQDAIRADCLHYCLENASDIRKYIHPESKEPIKLKIRLSVSTQSMEKDLYTWDPKSWTDEFVVTLSRYDNVT